MNTTTTISLNSIEKVKAFVEVMMRYEVDADLISGRYIIDAKSIMGIFSLDLSKPLELVVHSDANLTELMAELEPFTI